MLIQIKVNQHFVLFNRVINPTQECVFSTSNFVQKAPLRIVFSTPFSRLDILLKQAISCWICYKKCTFFFFLFFALYLPPFSEPKVRDFYPAECQSFRRLSDYLRRFLETSKDVPKNSEVLKLTMRLGSTEKEQSSRIFFLQNQ